MAAKSALAQVGGPAVAPPGANRPEGTIPFRRATTFRTTQVTTSTQAIMTAATQPVDVIIEGSGYFYAVDLECQVVTAANAAVVAYTVDGIWTFLDSVVLRDVNGELINLTGYNLMLANRYCGYRSGANDQASTDVAVFNRVAGAGGGLGGSFRFHLYVPVGLNRRSLWGIVGNQDRAQKYSLRSDIGAFGNIYATSPTTQGVPTINRVYENYAVPAPSDANGHAQAQFPDKFGILHFITQSVNPTPPAGGSTQNHYLARLGNTIRVLILVLRSNGSRLTAETNAPSRIQFNLGDTPLFVETPNYRRELMFIRYGFDIPGVAGTDAGGVYVYDAITDFAAQAGYELGDDYFWTSGLVNAQFQIAYPAGFGAAANSLQVITDDLLIPPSIDIYS